LVHFFQLIFVVIILALVGLPLFSKKTIKNLFAERDPVLEEYKHLLVRKEEVLLSIKELEFDLKTGKLSDSDYSLMKVKLQAEAVSILEKIDVLEKNKKMEKKASSEKLGPYNPIY
jgi:hypothetical protein